MKGTEEVWSVGGGGHFDDKGLLIMQASPGGARNHGPGDEPAPYFPGG